MSVERFHGSRVFQSGDDPVFVQFVSTAVVGLLVAVDPAELPVGYSMDTPFVVRKATDAADLPDAVKQEIDTVFDQVTTPTVVVMVDEGSDATARTANAVGDAAAKTGMHAFKKHGGLGLPKPKLLAAPGLTAAGAPDGVLSVSVTTAGSGYDPEQTTVTVSDGGGTGAGAELEPVIVDGALSSIRVLKPGYGYTGPLTVTVTDASGSGSGAVAEGTVGQVLNPVVAEGLVLAAQFRAMFFADGPDGTDEQAIAYAGLTGDKRLHACDPRFLKSVAGVSTPCSSSTLFAASYARMDRERNVAWPATNIEPRGIIGVNRPVDYQTEATPLNEAGVNTIINRGDGFRLWGGKTAAVGTIWEFANVVRVHDLANESIEEAFVQFIGRPQSLSLLDQMAMAGRAALRTLESEGILLPGSRFGLSEGQDFSAGVQGIVKFAMALEAPAPVYDLRIGAYRNVQVAYTLLYDSVSGTVDTGELLSA